MGTTIKSGCGFYIHDGLKYLERSDLDCCIFDDLNEFQSKWIEVINEKHANILIGVFYRHPKKNSNELFNLKLTELFEKLKKENKLSLITGDFNYDLLKCHNNDTCNNFINNMYSNSFQPCITEPTRIVANNTPSILDNIFINVLDKHVISGNFLSKISDHLPNFVMIYDVLPKKSKTKRQIRDFSNFHVDQYKLDTAKIEINLIGNDINAIYEIFHEQVIKVINIDIHFKTLTN